MMYLLLIPFMTFAAEKPKVVEFYLPKEVLSKHKRRIKITITPVDIANSLRAPSPNKELEFKAQMIKKEDGK